MPHVKVGRSSRYDLAAVQQWLRERQSAPAEFKWSVWHFSPAVETPAGRLPAHWYEECRCADEAGAEKIMGLLVAANPGVHYRVGQSKPTDQPDKGEPSEGEFYLVSEEG
jgi:hypothetical protein